MSASWRTPSAERRRRVRRWRVSKARLVITAVVVEGRPRRRTPMACRARGSMSSSPATAAKVRQRSSLAHGARSDVPVRLRRRRSSWWSRSASASPPRASTPAQTRSSGTSQHHHQIRVSRATVYRILRRASVTTANRRRNRSRPTFASRPTNPTNAGKPTSPTGDWPTRSTSRSCAGSMITLATHCRSHPTSGHRPDRRRHLPSSNPTTRHTDVDLDRQRNGVHHPPVRRHRRTQRLRNRTRPTTSHPEELPTQPPDHLRQSRTLPRHPQETPTQPTTPRSPSPTYKHNSTPSSTTTTTTDPTAHSHTEQPPQPSTPPDPKQHPANATTHTTASATTASPTAESACASPAKCTTSASDEPSMEPASSSSSPTSTSASSTHLPERSSEP